MKKILLIMLLLTGCASKPIILTPPPSYERLGAIKDFVTTKNKSFAKEGPNEEYARDYLLAMKEESLGNKKDACKLFSNLSEEDNFPLNQTALVHTFNSCNFSERELKSLWKKTQIASYLRETYIENSLKLATKFSMEEFVAEFSYELVQYKPLKAEKVQLLTNAIKIAQKLNLSVQQEKYTKKLEELSPQTKLEVTKENMYFIAKDYEGQRQFEKARDIYLDMINGDFTLEEKIKAYNAYRMSFKVARDLKMFLEKTGEMELYLRQLLEQDPSDKKLQEAWVDAKMNYARAVWTEHMNAEARLILDDILAQKIGTSTQIATAYWIYGSLHVESKENSDALKKYEKASEYKVATLDLQENIQWAVVWNKYLVKKYDEVVIDVDRFAKKSSNPNFINKLNFWKGRALTKLNRTEEAKAVFAATAANDLFGYYGLISAMESKTPLSPLPPSEISREPSGNLILDWLIAVEEKDFSIRALKEINSQFKSVADREKAMSLYAQTGWYQGGMLQIYNFPMKMRDELTKKYVSVIYPTPYQDIFSRYSQKYKVPEALPYAIARQESAFNTNVRSWADAFGLMQLIPEKGSELSKKYSVPYKNFNDLYKPEINVEMGTALLADLRKKFKGQFAQSVAGYNASTSAIAVWEKERFNGDYLEFIEMIPYEETRNYIKLVFRNYITYRRTLEKEEILIPEDFFAHSF